jgi:pentapeptide repeat protein
MLSVHKLKKIASPIVAFALFTAVSDVIIFHRSAAVDFLRADVGARIPHGFFEPTIAIMTGLALLGLLLALRSTKSSRAVRIVTIAVVVMLTLWLLPKEQIASLSNVKNIDPKELFKAENDARTTLAQMIGGFAVLIGLYFAWKNITSAQEGQITERFTKAIDQLGAIHEDGKLKLEVRLGGIYALERIARDSEKDHWPIMEILTAYVREHAVRVQDENPDVKPLTKDIQAILTVVGRRARTYGNGEDQALDLRNAFLKGANLSGAHLEEAKLSGAHLEEAKLSGAHLEGAYLSSVTGLAQMQLNLAIGNKDTRLSSGLVVIPESWLSNK